MRKGRRMRIVWYGVAWNDAVCGAYKFCLIQTAVCVLAASPCRAQHRQHPIQLWTPIAYLPFIMCFSTGTHDLTLNALHGFVWSYREGFGCLLWNWSQLSFDKNLSCFLNLILSTRSKKLHNAIITWRIYTYVIIYEIYIIYLIYGIIIYKSHVTYIWSSVIMCQIWWSKVNNVGSIPSLN